VGKSTLGKVTGIEVCKTGGFKCSQTFHCDWIEYVASEKN
jgi:hypothetical protein